MNEVSPENPHPRARHYQVPLAGVLAQTSYSTKSKGSIQDPPILLPQSHTTLPLVESHLSA
jgi:hypothetical protein